MQRYTKKITALLREYSMEAYERELHRELVNLDRIFDKWRDGKISSGELSYQIHQYETGPRRELYKKYNDLSHEVNVAYAIATGILSRDEVPAGLLEAISSLIDFYQSLNELERTG
jgi:Ca2+-binding EF-hand superfamily protein